MAKIAAARVARLDVDQHVVDDDRGHLVVARAKHAAEGAEDVQIRSQLQVVEAREQTLEIGRLVRERRLGQLDIALLDRRAENHLSPDADGRRLRASRRGGAPRLAGRSRPGRGTRAASRREARRSKRRECRATRSARLPSSTLTLHLRHVPWPPQVESIAMPFQLAASKSITPGGTRTLRRGRLEERGRTGPGRRGPVAVRRRPRCQLSVRARRVATVAGRLGSPKARHVPADACWDRCAAIQDAPQGSRSSRRSAALIARTSSGERASMMALVRPAFIAMERNAAADRRAVGHPERDVRGPERHVHAELVVDERDRLQASSRRGTCRHRSASPSGSSTMSSTAMPYSPVRHVHDLAGELEAALGLLGDLVLVVRQRDDRGAVALHERKDRFEPLVLGCDRVDERLALVGRKPGVERLDHRRVDAERQIGEALDRASPPGSSGRPRRRAGAPMLTSSTMAPPATCWATSISIRDRSPARSWSWKILRPVGLMRSPMMQNG